MCKEVKQSRETMLAIVREALPLHRYQHTLRVAETAGQLAQQYGVDLEKADLAALLHDYAKYRPLDEMRTLIETKDELPDDLLDYHTEVWHAFVGAYLVEKELGIQDQDVLAAIRYHTTGRAGMSLLEKVIYLADYIEPGRQFPGVEQVRELARKDLDQAVLLSLERTIAFIEQKGEKVYPLTRAAYTDLKSTKGGT